MQFIYSFVTDTKCVYFILLRYPPESGRSNDLDQSSHLLTVATRDLFTELDKNVKPVAPMQFWTVHFISLCFHFVYCTSFSLRILKTNLLFLWHIIYDHRYCVKSILNLGSCTMDPLCSRFL